MYSDRWLTNGIMGSGHMGTHSRLSRYDRAQYTRSVSEGERYNQTVKIREYRVCVLFVNFSHTVILKYFHTTHWSLKKAIKEQIFRPELKTKHGTLNEILGRCKEWVLSSFPAQVCHFHAIFGEIWSNNKSAAIPLGLGSFPVGEICICHCYGTPSQYLVLHPLHNFAHLFFHIFYFEGNETFCIFTFSHSMRCLPLQFYSSNLWFLLHQQNQFERTVVRKLKWYLH